MLSLSPAARRALLGGALLSAVACSSGDAAPGGATAAGQPAYETTSQPPTEPPSGPPTEAATEAATEPPSAVVGGQEDASSDGSSVAEPRPSCTPAPAVDRDLPADFPAGLDLPARTVLTGVDRSAGSTVVSGRVRAPVEDVLAHFREAVAGAGLVVQRDESEGRSGELLFFGAETEGGVAVAKLSCPAGSTSFTVRAGRPDR